MNVIAINASPRKTKNTGTLLAKALEGAASKGAQTELVHLYDLQFKGCVSCFACKVKNCKTPGICLYKDELSPILEKCMQADAIILGSPVYFWDVTGEMRSFLERLMFPVLTYTEGYKGLLERNIPVGFIYTMNVTREFLQESEYIRLLEPAQTGLERFFGYCEALYSYNTVQFDDYSKYVCTVFDEGEKLQVRKEQFPIDCEDAFELGIRLAGLAKSATTALI